MLGEMIKSCRWVGVAFAGLMLGIFQTIPSARADRISIVVGDVEYTREGQTDERAHRAIQAYLEYLMSRLRNAESQSVTEYIRRCNMGAQRGAPCPFPDFYIRLQFAERQGEVQIAGAVDQKLDAKNGQSHNVNPIRVRMGSLPEGLTRVVKNIEAIISSTAAPAQRVHIGITCFGSGADEASPRRRYPPGKFREVAPAISPLSQYAERLGKVAEALIGNESRIIVPTKKGSTAECSSPDALEAMAKAAGADAIVMGRIFADDRGGSFVTPQVYVAGGSRTISLRPIPVPEGSGGGPSSLVVARNLVATVDALLDSPRNDLVRVIGDGTEVSYYLDKAQTYLKSSPPQYDLADALLDLAMWKEPKQAKPYLQYASSLMGRLRFKEAGQVLNAGIEQVAEPKDLYAALAESRTRAGDLGGARDVYEKGLAKGILAQDALLGIARTYFAAKPPDTSRAIDYALRAARPQNPVSIDAYSFAGEVALSANDFKKASANDSKEVEENFKKAEEYFQEGRGFFPASAELVSRLSNLYERWAAEETKKGNYRAAMDALTKSISVFPASRKYYDLASAELEYFTRTGDGVTGYKLASEHYQRATEIARNDGTLLTDFPWLLPNLAEVLIFEGKFEQCKAVVQELFFALNSDQAVRLGISPSDLRLIAAFLNAAAELLSSGSAAKEVYLFENLLTGMDLSTIAWSFETMDGYLDKDYPKFASEVEVDRRVTRVARVKELIERIEKGRETAVKQLLERMNRGREK